MTTSEETKNLKLYSIYDAKLNKFMPPFFCASENDAIRQAQNIASYEPSLISKFPEDYSMFYVGDFDETNGQCITPLNDEGVLPRLVANFTDFVREDSIKYDSLKKDIEHQNYQISGMIKEFDDKVALYEKKLHELSLIEDKLKQATKSVELPPVPAKKLVAKKSFIDKLFNA